MVSDTDNLNDTPIFNYDEKYMRRALQLAARSPFDTHPNPMVGAVIVCDGRIIGEGFHRRCGEGHAEVNAVASVGDKSLLERSTMYVTLEPCSHYGKTPPCARLIIENRIPRVVVGAVDPFKEVSGRGIAMLREAGVEVISGVLAEESLALNERFIAAHTRRRPFVTLKWAQSSDGFLDHKPHSEAGAAPFRFSNASTTMLVHRERALNDAILTTAMTYIADRPRLDVRNWDGPSPRRFIVDRTGLLNNPNDLNNLNNLTNLNNLNNFNNLNNPDIASTLERLYSEGVTSVLVEAGPRYLQAFIDSGLWDIARIETSPHALGASGSAPSPTLPAGAELVSTQTVASNRIDIYRNAAKNSCSVKKL